MDTETRNRFRSTLEAERQRILTSAKNSLGELAVNANEQGGDEGDLARSLAEMHLAMRHADRERNLLSKIQKALQKIDEGSYGECEDCGDEIGIRRLETRPIATLCIKCKEAEERTEKAFAST